jgi:hypothetical protein
MSKDNMATSLGCNRATIFRAIEVGLKKNLLEKHPTRSAYRTTRKWVDTVVLYSKKK